LDVGGGVNAAPVISGKFLVVTSIEGVVHILDLTTGEKRLDYSIRQNVLSTPAFLGNVLIVATDEGNLLALDATKVEYLFERMLRRFRSQWFLWGLQDTPPTPKGFLWSRPLERDSKATSPAIADGRAYIVSTGGILHSVDVVTGDLYWAYDAGSPTKRRVAPVVAGDFVYMATIFGEVHVVDRIRGDLVKMFTIEAEPSAQLVVADGTLYIPGEDGSLTSIR
jgi:outer membrane protein assembly factor BamB